MKGSYVLYIELRRNTVISVGALGKIAFKMGYYAYVGSALSGLSGRVLRHLRKNKRLHWHIDHLLAKADVKAVYILPSGRREECMIAQRFASVFPAVAGFGCSDCKCKSHLFYSKELNGLRGFVK